MTRDETRARDAADPLAEFRKGFVIADPELTYLDGNSLGRLPAAASLRVREVVDAEWGEGLISSWNAGWMDLPARIAGKTAGLLGAAPEEVALADSTSVNLFKLALAALRAAPPDRADLVTDDLNFPSDHYILRSALDLAGRGGELKTVRSPDGISVPIETLAAAIDARTALVSLSHTAFKSAYVYDMAAVNEIAHRRAVKVLWDLSHSAGALPVDLDGSGADLAVGCTYKYLNGGPGAPAFLYVRSELQEQFENPIRGWFGHADPFAFDLGYQPGAGIGRFLTGTPPILSVAAIEPGVDLLLEAGMDRVREKSVAQTEYLIRLWQQDLQPLGFRLNSPREAERRGSHVSLAHPEGYRINRALIEQLRVIPDFRLPDNIRFGVCPLYTTFEEIHRAAEACRRVVTERLYERYSPERQGVT
jgi:kynureninase